MRTLNPNWLRTNPVDEQAQISSEVAIPDSVEDVQNNPDGTRPKVTIDMTAEFYMDILTTLSTLADSQEMLQQMAVESVADDLLANRGFTQEQLLDMSPDEFFEAAAPSAEWHDYEYSLGAKADDDREMAVELKVSAPSPIIGMQALVSMTQADRLQSLAIALCPTVEDDDEFADPNEVLVVD